MVEVIKQVEPGNMVPGSKSRIQGEVFSPKSCASGSEEGESLTGLCWRVLPFVNGLGIMRKTAEAAFDVDLHQQ